MDVGFLIGALGGIVMRIPWITVAVVGIVIAAVRREQHPRVSQLVIIALIIDLVLMLVNSFTSVIVPVKVMHEGGTATSVGMIMAGIGLCSSGFGALALGLLLWATFGWRPKPTETL